MDLTEQERSRQAETLTFLRDVLFDYRDKKMVGYEVISLLLNDPKLKLKVQQHFDTFYPKGLVKGYTP